MNHPLVKIDDYRWKISAGYKSGMTVPGIIYSDSSMIEKVIEDKSYEQVANAAALPGILKASMAMPDIHFGYGLPIGGVAAFDIEHGIVSPGGTGYDINCGVRLITTALSVKDISGKVKAIIDRLYSLIPTGVGAKGGIRLSEGDELAVIKKGAGWAVESGYGAGDDLSLMESNGRIEGADISHISRKAFERGRGQLGTLGSGNHFLEIQVVDKVFDMEAAAAYGIEEGMITFMIHTGSRGFGHQICTDYIDIMKRAAPKYNINLYDAQLACAPIKSKEGEEYLSAMAAAANYAWANRQVIMGLAIDGLLKVLKISPKDLGASLVYDVAHNIVKFEEHIVNGKKMTVAVHRKGATRAFPAGHKDIPAQYRRVGQPVIIPGDMGRNSFLLKGTEKAMQETFGSTCHGAGRLMSRNEAVRCAKGRFIAKELEEKGIILRVPDEESAKEEMPEAYKDISKIVSVVHNAGISLKVARMRPLGVIKG